MDELLLGLAAGLSFLFGWNNSSLLIGNLRGSGSLSLRAAAGISIVGLTLGVLLEGSKMTNSMAGSMAPTTTGETLLATFLISVAITLGLTLLGLPVSFSVVMVGAFLGASISSGVAVSTTRTSYVVAFWFVAPILAAALAYAIYEAATKYLTRFSVLTVDSLNRTGAVVSALAVSYTLGANNIGLIAGTTGAATFGSSGFLLYGLLALAAIIGVVVLGRTNMSGTIGDKMLALSPQGVFSAFIASSAVVWAGTQLAIPISISQCLLGGMLGAAYTKSIAIINRRLALETLSLWVVAPVFSFVLGWVIVRL